MCSKPWGDVQVCYPTRVGHPGTVLDGEFYDNNCDDGQSMCSPWTQPGYQFITRADLDTAISLYMGDEPAAVAQYGAISTWDTSLITDMSAMFFRCDLVQWRHLQLGHELRREYVWHVLFCDLVQWRPLQLGHELRHDYASHVLWCDLSNWDTSFVTTMQ